MRYSGKGLYNKINQKITNQTVPLNLFLFLIIVIKINIRNEIIRRFRGSKKKLNIFEKIKNKQLTPYYTLVGKFFEGLESVKKGWSIAG